MDYGVKQMPKGRGPMDSDDYVDRHEPIEGGYQTTPQPYADGCEDLQRQYRMDGVREAREMVEREHPILLATLTPLGEAVAGFQNGPGDGGAKALFAAQAADMVNSPAHYTQGPVETIDVIRQFLGDDGFKAFCLGNVLKYVSRARFKGNPEQDSAKAAWYARMAAGDDPRRSK